MKRLFLLTAIAGIFAVSNVSAQRKDPAMSGQKLGIGVDFALPTGTTNDYYKLGVGGSLQFQTPIAHNLNFTGSAGYLSFTGKEYLGGILKTPTYAAIPLKAGLRYFVAENFYVGGELGAAIGTSSGANTAFVYSPGAGFEFPVANKSTVEIGARYEGWSSGNNVNSYVPVKGFVGLRLAYNFGL
ncbi:outer membrane beta-barrel protein [Pedobacter cryoconitis]|uniref:Outer membrane protein with beta-barrel domain n=1 Tax=Pedobacter cryoconitis TaxID=188932 RepID=A0A327T1J4_9SPHI|nr:outer membrane beta-barrel protein [Pedobacter cryoconitis]RAJ31657.1 outer membrane protein with beta-barrel domain [Pedobacter cryoconitis]